MNIEKKKEREPVVDPNCILINVDGKEVITYKGAMLIDAADNAGIPIPRFCYHKKLSVAANCRMCLVDIERAPKPMPACATPVSEGMIVRTRSDKARNAQKSVMEFLLINHPLDCPICDQGGECELQDVSVAYGKDTSLFNEEKLCVADNDLGALIATHMTRCIACTRCIRFGDEIAGLREMGATGRGDTIKVGTYVTKELVSEISGNIIDICPVGALTAKPSQYQARPWEYVSHDSLSIHDGLGTNTTIHTLRGEIHRVVPRQNEEINEVWISDRDRFSCEAIVAHDRALTPLVRMGSEGLKTESWLNALAAARMALEGIKNHYGADQIGVLISPYATVEEMYLAQKMARSLGIANIDHRLTQSDFSDDAHDPVYPALGLNITDVNHLKSAFLIGADLRMEVPLLGVRMRDAVKKNQAKISMLASYDADQLHEITHKAILAPHEWIGFLSEVLSAILFIKKQSKDQTADLPATFDPLLKNITVSTAANELALTLLNHSENDAECSWIVLGNDAISHPQFATIRALSEAIALLSGSAFGMLSKGANAVGGYLSGAVPHRLPAGKKSEKIGLNAHEMLNNPLKAYLLIGAIDPELDLGTGQSAYTHLKQAEVVVSLTPFASIATQAISTVILPVSAWGETAGSLINMEGRCQSVSGAAAPQGEARPLWKVLRVLANQFDLEGFEYVNVDDVLDEWLSACDQLEHVSNFSGSLPTSAAFLVGPNSPYWLTYQGIYQTDSYVRRSVALQKTPLANILKITVHPETAALLNLEKTVDLTPLNIPVRITSKMAPTCVRVARGFITESETVPAIVGYQPVNLGA